MTRNTFAIAALILVLSNFNARAQTLVDRGGETCEKWAAVHSTTSAAADVSAFDNWVIGYLQGKANVIASEDRTKGMTARNILLGLDGPTIVRLTGEYCGAKPLQTVAQAADQLAAQAIAGISPRAGGAPAQAQTKDRPPGETTGSGAVTGQMPPDDGCRIVTTRDALNNVVRRFRKCD